MESQVAFLESFNQKLDNSVDLFILQTLSKNPLTTEKKEKLRNALFFQMKNDYADFFEVIKVIDTLNFGDEHSLDLFAQEMCFLLFRTLNADFALNYVSPVTNSQIKTIYDEFSKKTSELNLPIFGVVEGNQALYPIFTTFYMRQYAYDIDHKFEIEPGEIVLNCGACMGDSTIWFYREGAAKVYDFEPMPNAFNALQHNLKNNNYPTDLSYRLAVGDKNQELIFKEQLNHVGSSHEASPQEILELEKSPNNKSNLIKVQCVALDEWLPEHNIKPTYIKMDLEGAEPEAIEGLKNTISTLKPKLAVCLYHRPSDMWTLPKRIQELNPGYKFYCKKSLPGHEFVLFAIDQNQA